MAEPREGLSPVDHVAAAGILGLKKLRVGRSNWQENERKSERNCGAQVGLGRPVQLPEHAMIVAQLMDAVAVVGAVEN